MGLAGTLTRMANKTVSVSRDSGAYVDGRYVDAAATTFEIKANVQPAPTSALSRLPEGSRVGGAISVFPAAGSTALRTASTGAAGHNADRITVDGQQYEVAGLDTWVQHTRYIATRYAQ